MYVTRRMSQYLRDPTALSLPPPEGPNSGVLVIQDDDSQPACCSRFCKSDYKKTGLPFSQNYNLIVEYVASIMGKYLHTYQDPVVFIPVLNQPLSSNQYYCIDLREHYKGLAHKSSREEDNRTSRLCRHIIDVEPETCNPLDIYQQFKIKTIGRKYACAAKSVSADGFPPRFLRRLGWTVSHSTSTQAQISQLTDAQGLDLSLRARLPKTDFPLSEINSEAVVVGKWYCPFILIKDRTPEYQMDRSRYYEMTLEQRWEQIFMCDNNVSQGDVVDVDVVLETEAVELFGKAAVKGGASGKDGIEWFRMVDKVEVTESDVGLSSVIVERMKWEESRFGWTGEREVRVKRHEKFGGKSNEWKKFGCYILVERFVLKRMYGGVVLTYDFKHPQHVITKWE